MSRLLAVTFVMLAMSACATGTPEATGAIRGHVSAGPTCPMEGPGQDCDPAPWEGTVRATATDGTTVETATDQEGSYALRLAAGTYVVVAVTDAGTLPMGVPVDVTVAVDTTLTVDLQVDTGIR